MAEAPVLETPRLILRGRTLDDFEAYAALWADPLTVRYTVGAPQAREESWVRFARMAGLWALTGYGSFVVVEKASGRFVGDVGPADYGRDIVPPLGGKPEFGWVVAPAFHGRGYATEAVAASVAWAERKFPGTPFVCIIDAANAPSRRIAAKAGFAEAGLARYKGKDIGLYERPPRN